MYPSQPQPGYPPSQPGYPAQPAQPAGTSPMVPPSSLFDTVAGYEQTSYGQGFAPPPPVAPPMTEQPKPDEEFTSAANITVEEAQDAMLSHVAENCCYGSSPAKEMMISDIKPSSAYHYTLSTFTEGRSTAWEFEPFTGQMIDGPHNGRAPGPWQIITHPKKTFSDSQTKIEVPHTATIKQCHTCYGSAFKQCSTCLGRGWGKCNSCQGKGTKENQFNEQEQCGNCQGRGEARCSPCNGEGRIKCETCKGNARLKTFIQLTVKWTNHYKDHTLERSQGGPKEKVGAASGIEIFHQEQQRVWPISTFFENEINVASQRIVSEHSNNWPQERILLQRQTLKAVPVAEVSYTWKDVNSKFWVYGTSPRQVFAPDYPQQCCCGCVIL